MQLQSKWRNTTVISVENAVKEMKEQVSGINGRLDTAEEKLSMINVENKMMRNRVNELEPIKDAGT